MTEVRLGAIQMTAAMAISGTIGWLVVLSGRPVPEVVFWRCVFGALTLLPVCAAMGLLWRPRAQAGARPARKAPMTLRQLLWALLGGVAIVANWLLLFAAYSRASISVATVVYNTQPFMLVALGALFLGERLTPVKLGWLLLSFAGLVLIVLGGPQAGAHGGGYLAGVLLSLGAAFCYAVAAFIAKRLRDVPPHLIALVQMGVGMLMVLPFGLDTFGGAQPVPAQAWALLAVVGVVHTGLVYILLYGAIQRLPTHLTGALSFIYPVVACVVDRLAFGHRLDALQMLGSAAILLAAAGTMLGWDWPAPWHAWRGAGHGHRHRP